ncbi:hypothetical protein [Pseudodesulfovibrio tunisiensis]|uniref:hypothetical protein n=1 Tax=Pseudodesulfovibrio tunisiensis TaxID=463192 RepID=UPI001FB320BE|nr:hypothetical protein [Pseudodesulfovibrio tunisiensis]
MKKITTVFLTLALVAMTAVPAFADSHMNHGSNHGEMSHGTMEKQGAASMHDGMKTMEDNLHMMQMDVDQMKAPEARKAAMASMDTHMADMHHGMMTVEEHASQSGNKDMQKAMKQMNKDMMTTMKGMGMMKKNPDAAIPMMTEGIEKMQKTLTHMKSMM